MSISDLVKDLNARWYNALCTEANLSPQNFQLAQGAVTVVQTTDPAIWSLYDQVPLLSLIGTPVPSNQFSGEYGAVLSQLMNTSGQKFQMDMGSYYPKWQEFKIEYFNKNMKAPGLAEFKAWAKVYMPEGQASKVITDYEQMMIDPIGAGVDRFTTAKAANKGAFPWNVAEIDVATAIEGGQNISVSMTQKTSDDIAGTWAGSIDLPFSSLFVGGGAKGSWSEQMAKTMSVEGTIYGLAGLPAQPLNQPSQEPTLQEYEPWFNAGTLTAALDKSNWKDPNQYGNYFGPAGRFNWSVAEVVFFRSLDLTLKAQVTVDDRAKFEESARAGIWPFYVSQSVSVTTKFHDQQNVEINIKTSGSTPMILGYVVAPVSGKQTATTGRKMKAALANA